MLQVIQPDILVAITGTTNLMPYLSSHVTAVQLKFEDGHVPDHHMNCDHQMNCRDLTT